MLLDVLIYNTVGCYSLPRAPAMNPRMRAFSARLTRFAFLNISCAANICSRCEETIKNTTAGQHLMVLVF